MKLGTYTTFDCPTGGEEVESKALSFLNSEFGKIGGIVRKAMNPHDLGVYPSFEIDYPEILDEHEGDDCVVCQVGDNCPLSVWHDKADLIQEAYNKKFEENL